MIDIKTPLNVEEINKYVEYYKTREIKRTFKTFIVYLYCVILLRCKSSNH